MACWLLCTPLQAVLYGIFPVVLAGTLVARARMLLIKRPLKVCTAQSTLHGVYALCSAMS